MDSRMHIVHDNIDGNRRSVGVLNPMHDRYGGMYVPGGRRENTCDHGLSRRSLVRKLPCMKNELAWRVNVPMKIH